MRNFIRIAAIAASVAAFSPAAASAAAPQCPNPPAPTSAADAAAVRPAILCLVNAERTAKGLPKLRAAGKLHSSATRYARRMVRKNFFSHNRRGLIRRVRGSGFLRNARRWSLGENIAWGSGANGAPETIVRAWMASPRHRRNILARKYRRIGIGVVAGAPVAGTDGATYVTDFGRRRG